MIIERDVFFDKPNIKALKDEGLTSVDMHVHSQYSDTFTRVNNIIKKAQKKGTGIAITDHNEIKGALELCKNKKLLTIPGIEVTSKEGPHLLFYFYDASELKEFYNKKIKNFKSKNPYRATKIEFKDLINSSRDYSCIVAPAHPCAASTMNLHRKFQNGEISKTTLDKIKVMEAVCGQNLRGMNLKGIEWISELKKGFTGGSDAHTLLALASVVTSSEASDRDSFLESILKKKNVVIGQEMRILPRIVPYSKLINKHAKYVPPFVNINYELDATKKQIYKMKPVIKNSFGKMKVIFDKGMYKFNFNKR